MGQQKQLKGGLGPPPSSPGKKCYESPTPNPIPPLTDSDSIKAKTELTSGKDDGADCCHWDTRRDDYAHIIAGRRGGDKSKVCKYDEESY